MSLRLWPQTYGVRNDPRMQAKRQPGGIRQTLSTATSAKMRGDDKTSQERKLSKTSKLSKLAVAVATVKLPCLP